MPPRSTPTARQQRLGAELRKLREHAGLTARVAAGLLGTDQQQISHIEAGRVGVSEERIRRLAVHYACDDAALVSALVAMATERMRGWWEDFRGVLSPGFLDLSEFEFHASCMRTIQITNIPGIMQTEAHARAVFAYAVPELTPHQLEARVAHRIQRRVVFERDSPPEFDALIHEAALRIRVGDEKIAREQFDHILESADRPEVSIRVIPFNASWFGGAGYSMLYMGGPGPELDTVQLDAAHDRTLLDAEAQIRRHRNLFRKVANSSLGMAASRDFIYRIAREL
jgi:transcriptional regulator with XRE-family HTH domain